MKNRRSYCRTSRCAVKTPQRTHELREVLNAARYMVKTAAPWRWMPGDFPPWPPLSADAALDQSRVFEAAKTFKNGG
jgi:transposase